MTLPESFIRQMETVIPPTECTSFFQAIYDEPVTSIRLNPFKTAHLLPHEKVGWCTSGYYLPTRPTFTADPLFHAGCYYVQEASSMFVDTVIRQFIGDRDIIALDLCAAPGGKSTLLRSALSENSLLLSNEYIRNRAQILAENMIKWGHERAAVCSNAPSDFHPLHHAFDLILADVPCSGEGMFRKDETAIREWSTANVLHCQDKQREIIGDIWNSLRLGGLLIYSTCTYNTLENEENVAWICNELGGSPLEVQIAPEWQIRGSLVPTVGPVYRFMPHATKGEGLFLAVIRKEADSDLPMGSTQKKKEKHRKSIREQSAPNEIKAWLTDEAWTWNVTDNHILAIPTPCLSTYRQWDNQLYLLKPFLTIAERKGHDWIPTHELAMSRHFRQSAFPSVEVDAETALAYLRKEPLHLPSSTPKGIVVIMFRNYPLGFVKHVGNRANNLYPQEWRIRNASLTYAAVL